MTKKQKPLLNIFAVILTITTTLFLGSPPSLSAEEPQQIILPKIEEVSIDPAIAQREALISTFIGIGILALLFVILLIIAIKKKYSVVPCLSSLKFGWEKTKLNLILLPLILIAIFLVQSSVDIILFLISKLSNVTLPDLSLTAITGANVLAWLLFLISVVLKAIVTMGLVRVSLDVASGQPPSLSKLFSEWKLTIHFLIAQLLYTVIVTAGMILLIVPGIIFSLGFLFWPYVLVDQKCSSLQALKKAWALVRGGRWELFLFIFLVTVLNILGVFALGIGLLVTLSVTVVAMGYMYRQLNERMAPTPSPSIATSPAQKQKIATQRTPSK